MADEKKQTKEERIDEKYKAAMDAMDQIKTKFGDGAIMKFGEAKKSDVDAIPTGCLSLDIALGIGGVPRGRVIEVFGPEASGKTTIAQHIVAEVQKMGGIAAFVDAEHALDPEYAGRIGINVKELLISQPDTGEQALEIVETLVRSNAVDVIVIDSVAALVPQKEIEGDMGDSHMGLQARLMSQALRKLTAVIAKTKTVVIFINQIRMKLGVFFGNPETTPGGNALKFYSSVRLEIRRKAVLKRGDDQVGNHVVVKVVKNKLAPPFRQVEFDLMFGQGISKIGEIIDLGVEKNVIKKSGSWFSYGDTKLGQGREAVKQLLLDNEELSSELEEQIRQALKE
jgi:recombination protein RecA